MTLPDFPKKPPNYPKLWEENLPSFSLSRLVDYECARADAAMSRLRLAVEALNRLAAFDDGHANAWLERHQSYGAFDEPGSVSISRETIKAIGPLPQDSE